MQTVMVIFQGYMDLLNLFKTIFYQKNVKHFCLIV
jgi:hypothetical protein